MQGAKSPSRSFAGRQAQREIEGFMNYIFLISGFLLGATIVYIIFQFVQRKNSKLLETQKTENLEAQNLIARLDTENRLLKVV